MPKIFSQGDWYQNTYIYQTNTVVYPILVEDTRPNQPYPIIYINGEGVDSTTLAPVYGAIWRNYGRADQSNTIPGAFNGGDAFKVPMVGSGNIFILKNRLPANTILVGGSNNALAWYNPNIVVGGPGAYNMSSVPYHYDVDNKVLDDTLRVTCGFKLNANIGNNSCITMYNRWPVRSVDGQIGGAVFGSNTIPYVGLCAFSLSLADTVANPQFGTMTTQSSTDTIFHYDVNHTWFTSNTSFRLASNTPLSGYLNSTYFNDFTVAGVTNVEPMNPYFFIDTDVLGRVWTLNGGMYGYSTSFNMPQGNQLPSKARGSHYSSWSGADNVDWNLGAALGSTASMANVYMQGYFTTLLSYQANSFGVGSYGFITTPNSGVYNISEPNAILAMHHPTRMKTGVQSVIMAKLYNGDLIMYNRDIGGVANSSGGTLNPLNLPSLSITQVVRDANTPYTLTLATSSRTTMNRSICWPANLVRDLNTTNTFFTYDMLLSQSNTTAPTFVRMTIDKNTGVATISNCTITFASNTFLGVFTPEVAPAIKYGAMANLYSGGVSVSATITTGLKQVMQQAYGGVYHQLFLTTVGTTRYLSLVQFDVTAGQIFNAPFGTTDAQQRLRRSITVFQVGANNQELTYHSSYVPEDHLGGIYHMNDNRTTMLFNYRTFNRLVTFNPSTGWTAAGLVPQYDAVCRDSVGRVWAIGDDRSTWTIEDVSAATVSVSIPDVVYTGSTVNANLVVDARYANGARANTSVRLALSGGVTTFSDNTVVTTITTSDAASTNVEIRVIGSGTIDVSASAII